ncbi:MAG: outer membrane protein assembly factor BamC [Gammaproteobacteria bacterium]
MPQTPYFQRRFQMLFALGLATALVSGCANFKPIETTSIETEPLEEYEKQWALDTSSDSDEARDIYAIGKGQVSVVGFNRRNLPRAREIISSGLTRAVRLHRLGTRYWLSAEMPPSILWPLLNNYWNALSIEIAATDPAEGTFTTKLVEQPDGTQISYTLRVESGLRSGSSEVSIQIQGAENNDIAEEQRQQLIDSQFRDILKYLGQPTEITSSILVQHLDFKPKMITDYDPTGHPFIQLGVPANRAWALLKSAVDTLNWDVTGVNQTQQVLEISYLLPEQKKHAISERWDHTKWTSAKIGLTVPATAWATAVPAETDSSNQSDDREHTLVQLQVISNARNHTARIQLSTEQVPTTTAIEIVSQLVQTFQ